MKLRTRTQFILSPATNDNSYIIPKQTRKLATINPKEALIERCRLPTPTTSSSSVLRLCHPPLQAPGALSPVPATSAPPWLSSSPPSSPPSSLPSHSPPLSASSLPDAARQRSEWTPRNRRRRRCRCRRLCSRRLGHGWPGRWRSVPSA